MYKARRTDQPVLETLYHIHARLAPFSCLAPAEASVLALAFCSCAGVQELNMHGFNDHQLVQKLCIFVLRTIKWGTSPLGQKLGSWGKPFLMSLSALNDEESGYSISNIQAQSTHGLPDERSSWGPNLRSQNSIDVFSLRCIIWSRNWAFCVNYSLLSSSLLSEFSYIIHNL